MKKFFSILTLCISIFCTPQTGLALDTSHWKTYSVGRYLIDLPGNTEFYWHPLRFSGQYELVWQKGMTVEEAQEILIKEAEEAKKAPHITAENQLIYFQPTYGLDGDGSFLVRHPSANASTYLFKAYFVNMTLKGEHLNKGLRVYYYEEETLDLGNMPKETLQFINYMSANIISTEPVMPTMRTAGTHFEGGVFIGPGKAPYPAVEYIAIEARFPEHPGILFRISFNHINLETRSIINSEGGISGGVLRRAKTTIAGNPAVEILSKFQKEGVTNYSFSLNGPSKTGETRIEQIPIILMHLKNPRGGVIRNGISTAQPPIKRPSFASDEEAMAFWDAIRNGIRWRPDDWRIPSPDEPYFAKPVGSESPPSPTE